MRTLGNQVIHEALNTPEMCDVTSVIDTPTGQWFTVVRLSALKCAHRMEAQSSA